MAQYNLVGYNAAPTNPEYDITRQGLSQIPRTNWAEYGLKKEEMRENKKLNRIKTAVDTAGKIASIAATGVDMYQAIDQMDLKKESLKLDNNLKSLDIQSKTIDVSNKADQVEKDLAYTNKIRELQAAQDWTGVGALVMSDIGTAQRNSGVTKSIIEQLKFNKIDQADQLFATIFPDEQYKRDQDTLNRQQAITLKSMETNSPYQQALARKANAEASLYEAQASGVFGGKSIADMKKENAEYEKLLTNAEAVIGSNGALSQAFETHNIDFVAENKDPNSSFHMYARDMNELKKQYDLLMQLKLSKESLEGKDFSLLQDLYGSEFETTLTNMSEDVENIADKKQWLTFTKNGEPFNVLTDRATATTLTRAYNGAVKRSGYIVMNKTDSLQGDLSQMGYRDFLALSKLPPTTLQGVVEKYPHILESATAQQQNWDSFDKLVKAVTNVTHTTNTPVYSSIQNEGGNSNYSQVQGSGNEITNIKQIVSTLNPNDSNYPQSLNNLVARFPEDNLEKAAREGANITGIEYDPTMSKEEKITLASIAVDNTIRAASTEDIKNKDQQITQSVREEPIKRKVTTEVQKQLRLNPNDDIEDSINKLRQDQLDKISKISDKGLAEDARKEYIKKEIQVLAKELGELLDKYNITVRPADIRGARRVILNSSKAVNNFVNYEYSRINSGKIRSLPKDHTEHNLREDLVDFLQDAIARIKYNEKHNNKKE